MATKALAKLFLLLIFCEVLLVSVHGWRRRRRRRCDTSRPSGVAWVNNWHQSFYSYCSNGNSLRLWRSHHRNCLEDRVYYFRCGYGPVPYKVGNCAWTHYVNSFDHPVSYRCPHNGFLTGVKSEYSGHHRDRRFGFRCCHVAGYYPHHCYTTTFLNYWDRDLYYWVPSYYYLVGVYSVHHNHYEDRRWRFDVCQFGKYFGK